MLFDGNFDAPTLMLLMFFIAAWVGFQLLNMYLNVDALRQWYIVIRYFDTLLTVFLCYVRCYVSLNSPCRRVRCFWVLLADGMCDYFLDFCSFFWVSPLDVVHCLTITLPNCCFRRLILFWFFIPLNFFVVFDALLLVHFFVPLLWTPLVGLILCTMVLKKNDSIRWIFDLQLETFAAAIAIGRFAYTLTACAAPSPSVAVFLRRRWLQHPGRIVPFTDNNMILLRASIAYALAKA